MSQQIVEHNSKINFITITKEDFKLYQFGQKLQLKKRFMVHFLVPKFTCINIMYLLPKRATEIYLCEQNHTSNMLFHPHYWIVINRPHVPSFLRL